MVPILARNAPSIGRIIKSLIKHHPLSIQRGFVLAVDLVPLSGLRGYRQADRPAVQAR